MAQKRIGYYIDAKDATATPADQLILEIGNYQVACITKNSVSRLAEGFEIFQLDTAITDWAAALSELSSLSQLLNRSYTEVHIYYNFPEALIIPESTFSINSAEDYLAQIYGESTHYTVSAEKVLTTLPLINAYRLKRTISDWVKTHFPVTKSSHIYSDVLKDIFSRPEARSSLVSVRFYQAHLLIAVVKDKKLHLIQSFTYQTDEDILYTLLSIIKQFDLDPLQSGIDISGEFKKGSPTAQQLPVLFNKITWANAVAEGVFASTLTHHPAHFFTPYSKLVV